MVASIFSSRNKFRIIVCIVLFTGFFIRTVVISALPAGLNQDEASIGYEAYSIISSGMDRHGNSYPVHFISWGSGQNALYAYLSIPFIKIFGLNVFSVRIINAIFSCISILLFFFLFLRIYDKRKALTALILLSICPWSIMAARWGLESNIFPTFFLAGFFSMILGHRIHQSYYLLSSALFAIGLYAYGTSYLVVPLFLMIMTPYLYLTGKIRLRYLSGSLLLFMLVSMPIILFVIINHFDLQGINILNISIPRLDFNRTTSVFNILNSDFFISILKNSIIFFGILTLQTDGLGYNAIPAFGTIYHLSLIFFIVGLIRILSNKEDRHMLHNIGFICWLACSFILGITTYSNINRINIIFIPLLYFTIIGIIHVSEILSATYRKYFKAIIYGYYGIFFLMFVGYYSIVFNENNKDDFSYGLGNAILFAADTGHSANINISPASVNMPYIYVCFYTKMDPVIFKKSVVYNNEDHNGINKVIQLGRYTFNEDFSNDSTIQILSKEEFKHYKIHYHNYKEFGNYYVCNY